MARTVTIYPGARVRLLHDNEFFRMSQGAVTPPHSLGNHNSRAGTYATIRAGTYATIFGGTVGTVVGVFPRPIPTQSGPVLHIAVDDFVWEISAEFVQQILPPLDDLEEVERWLTR